MNDQGDPRRHSWPPASEGVTEILQRWQDGDDAAESELLPLAYDELRALARGYLRRERADHTLQPTALVHEAYVRLAGRIGQPWQSRTHFFAAIAKVMRQVLVDHSRKHAASKRGGSAIFVPIEDDVRAADPRATDLLALDAALRRLGGFDPRKARIIELRFFGGLTVEECAQLFELSSQTVINETRKARAWLYKELGSGGAGGGAGDP